MSTATLIPEPTAKAEQSLTDSLRTDSHFVGVLRRLSQVSAWRGPLWVAWDWTIIIACFAGAMAATRFQAVAWIAAGIVIATRQHALLILMHDASHFRLAKPRWWNDRISNWLCSWPVLVSTEGYRENHLAHHHHLNTDDDPDWVRKEGRIEWEFPKTKWGVARLMLRDLVGGGFFDQIKAIRDLSSRGKSSSSSRSFPWERLTFMLVAITAVTIADLWVPVALMWFLPAFTVLPVILRIRSIAEHFGVEGSHELNTSRNTYPGILEQAFLAPHNVGYHLDHHLYPSVPFYNLPQLHAQLMKHSEYASNAHESQTVMGRDETSVLEEITV